MSAVTMTVVGTFPGAALYVLLPAEFELAAALDKGVDMVWAEHVRSCTLPMAASCSTEIVCFTPTFREQTRIS